MDATNIARQDWHGCYNGGWQAAPLVPEAYSHPAKVSFALAERIYRHMLTEGWLVPGDVVVDPFGGIGGFAFHAALYGMHWTGIELEQKFVDLGNQNLALWSDRYAPHFPGYGTAVLVQGDSRRLVDLVTGAGGIVSSPPFAGSLNDGLKDTDREKYVEFSRAGRSMGNTYGSTPGQLGAMPAGVVTSPPYSETRIDGNGDEGASGLRDENGDYLRGAEGWAKRKELGSRYGESAGNIGNNTGDTFWSAAAQIVAQCYAILRPGGYAAFVTGDFVRNKKRVPFGEQWLALCVACGFEPVLWAVAHKSEHLGTQASMFGDDVKLTRTRVSFFRRLANQNNPDAAITNEDVIFVRKPLELSR